MTPDEIREFRERFGLSQAELAEALDLPNPDQGGQVSVARWEAGTHRPVPFLWRALRDLGRELAQKRRRKRKR